MGRVSVPMMNKSGYSMYWDSMWDDKLNYSRSLFETIFLKKFIYLFFENRGRSFHFDLKQYDKNKFYYFYKKYKFQVRKSTKKSEIGAVLGYKLFQKKNYFKNYASKIWILKFQNWIVVYFFLYSFKLNKFLKKKLKKKRIFKKYVKLVNNYYISTIKLKNNFNLYKPLNQLFNF